MPDRLEAFQYQVWVCREPLAEGAVLDIFNFSLRQSCSNIQREFRDISSERAMSDVVISSYGWKKVGLTPKSGSRYLS